MQRTRTLLNGEWQIALLADDAPPIGVPIAPKWEPQPILVPSSWRWSTQPEAALQPFDLFNYPSHWNEAPAALLRRTFDFTPYPDSRPWLILNGVLQAWRVFVNGTPCHSSSEGFLTTELDLSVFVHAGQNELMLWCGPWARVSTPTGNKLVTPNGSWFADLARGPWQDVVLENRPTVWLDKPAIVTSVRDALLTVTATVTNDSQTSYSEALRATVRDGETMVKSLATTQITVPAGAAVTHVWREPWPEAVHWSPERPHLYFLDIAVGSAEPAGIGDQTRTRFGFREVWFDGPDFYLNHIRTNLRGDAWHYQGFAYQTPDYARNWYRAARGAGLNFVRLHAMPYPEFFLDVADEEGMLIIDESAIYGSSNTTLSDHPEFIANCEQHLAALVKRDRNHPSVIIWSMQNEMRWVDGRAGYRDAMPRLASVMRALDPTRSIGFDGDNRLVPAEWCDIISMHYNIDGTIAEWDRTKPLIFGEHGVFHYLSPQVTSNLGGPQAYLSFEDAMAAAGQWESLFIAYARRQGVTGLTPFNLIHYAHWALPDEARHLTWDDPSTTGPKPSRIPAYTLAVDNGLLEGVPNRPNPAFEPLQTVCLPVLCLPDELDRRFYEGYHPRSFSLYNDTEVAAEAQLVWRLSLGDKTVGGGEWTFVHPAGERQEWHPIFDLPVGEVTLEIDLYHGPVLRHQSRLTYQVDSLELRRQPIDTGEKTVAIAGELGELAHFLPGAIYLPCLQAASLQGVDVLIVAPFYTEKAKDVATVLGDFVAEGGMLLVLEQDTLTLGELTLSGRPFFAAFPNPPDHPVFAGLSANDLCFWAADNPHQPQWQGLVNNAFHKPTQGDLELWLECGEGDFGWGGLLWTPLVAYRHGRGQTICCQVALQRDWHTVPQAAVLYRNLLAHCLAAAGQLKADAENGRPLPVVVDPNDLTDERCDQLADEARRGRTVLVLPATAQHEALLSRLAGSLVSLTQSETYQLVNCANRVGTPTAGMTALDLSGLDRATYTPATYRNTIVARYAIDVAGAEPLLTGPHNPWTDYFVRGLDGEAIKMAVATAWHLAPPRPDVYAARLPFGQGAIVFWQAEIDPQSDKGVRLRNRLLSNIGHPVETRLFDQQKEPADFGIRSLLGLPHAAHQSYEAMVTHFTSPGYSVNNLGEGAFGWMKRLEARDGRVRVTGSAGQTWFLTVFLVASLNHDPSLREAGTLPDSSIVPDLFLFLNCSAVLFVNGIRLWETEEPTATPVKVSDVVLRQGINRLVLVCEAGDQDIELSVWLTDKHGEPLHDVRTQLTLD
jgi:hypothetical protein